MILFEPGPRTGIFRIAAAGGTTAPVTKLDPTQHTTHRWPNFLPDGKHFLYLAANNADPRGASTEIYIASLDGKLNRPLMHSYAKAEYASGYLLYLRDTTLMARPFNPDELEFTGDATGIAENVAENASTWGAVFSVSQNGVLAYQGGGHTDHGELRWYDRQGRNLGALGSGNYYGPRLSPDGRFILLDNNFSTLSEVDVVPLAGDRKPYPFAQSQFPQRSGHFSPDGHWVAYTSRESGREEVYVAPFPGPGGKWQVSSSGGRMPRWRRDGRELYFVAEDDTLMAAEVEASPNKFEVKNVRPLFRVTLAPEARDRSGSFDVTADGTRFIMNASNDEAQPPITLVLNWPAELKKK